MTSPKAQIPYAELLEKVQGLLVGNADCQDLHIDSLEVYKEQIDGANWHVTRHRRSGSNNDWEACWEKILPDLRQLRVAYDVKTE